MFDDPNERLKELDFALKATQEEEEELDWLQDAKDFLNTLDGEPAVPIRNQANNYGRGTEAADIPRIKYADEDMTRSDALYVEAPKRKGAGGYMVLAILELIAIGLIGLWWLKWTL